MNTKTWLENEEILLRKQMRKKSKVNRSFFNTMTVLGFIFIGLFHISQCHAAPYAWHPQTWKCKTCGFDNFVGINACPMCGRNR